jgi:hypothetical protein
VWNNNTVDVDVEEYNMLALDSINLNINKKMCDCCRCHHRRRVQDYFFSPPGVAHEIK